MVGFWVLFLFFPSFLVIIEKLTGGRAREARREEAMLESEWRRRVSWSEWRLCPG
ncbi:hypothetical protein BJX65DRAFT_269641 [Aspergillus insuetus]